MENNSQAFDKNAPEKSDALAVVKEVDKELSDYRKQFEKDWNDYDNAYYGKQHKTGEDKKTVKNHIFKIVEGEVPILTDSMPGTQVTASLQDKQVDADNLNKAIRYVYQDQNLPLIIPSLVRQSLVSAPGWLYAYWNPDAEGGQGKLEYLQLPWEAVKVDGNAQTIEQAKKANICIPKTRGQLARMWPEKYAEIMDLAGSALKEAKGDSDNFERRDVSTDDEGMGKPQKASSKDILNYKETWVEDLSLEPIPSEDLEEELVKERQELLSAQAPTIGKWENHDAHMQDHANSRAQVLAQIGLPGDAPIEQVTQTVDALLQQNPEAQNLAQIVLTVQIIDNHIEEHTELKKLNPKGERPKFKDGWRLIKSAGNTLFYDGPNPEERNGVGHIPLTPFYCYKDATIYGFGEVKNIIDAQRTLNTVDWHEYENLKVNSNTGWIADHESEVDENKLTNAPGLVIKKKKGTEVRRQDPGTVSPQLERRQERDEMAMEEISGVNEATQGQLPSAGASGITVTKLQTQAIARIRLKDRYLQHYSIRRLGIITAQLILNHWSEEKRFRLRTDDGQIEDIVFNPLTMEDLNYTIEISAGSMAGIDKDALNAFFMGLLDKQHITFEEFLLVADFPKKEMLLTKLRERMQKDQSVQEVQGQLEQLQAQNIKLRGLIDKGLVLPEEQKVFEAASKQALLAQLMQEEEAQAQQEINGNPGVDQGQPVNQGNM
jgi:hypothetical protein